MGPQVLAARSGMSKSGSLTDLQERLAIAERAIADSAARIEELSRALGEITEGAQADEASQKEVTIGADSVSPFCIGFHQREYDAADRPYRWTGRGNLFELRIRVDRSFRWHFAMELQPNTHVDIGRLRAYVDYIEIPIEVSDAESLVRGVIPARPFGRQAVLTFLLPNLFVPNQVNPESTDTRSLGVVFYELRLVPIRLNEVPSDVQPEAVREDGKGILERARSSLAASVRPRKLS